MLQSIGKVDLEFLLHNHSLTHSLTLTRLKILNRDTLPLSLETFISQSSSPVQPHGPPSKKQSRLSDDEQNKKQKTGQLKKIHDSYGVYTIVLKIFARVYYRYNYKLDNRKPKYFIFIGMQLFYFASLFTASA